MARGETNSPVSLLVGALAGIGASACCAGPLVAISLGLGGAWVGQLVALEPYRPLFIALAALFFAAAFRRLYRTPLVCTPDQTCADMAVRGRQRLLFWLALVLTAGVIAFPWYAPLFY